MCKILLYYNNHGFIYKKVFWWGEAHWGGVLLHGRRAMAGEGENAGRGCAPSLVECGS